MHANTHVKNKIIKLKIIGLEYPYFFLYDIMQTSITVPRRIPRMRPSAMAIRIPTGRHGDGRYLLILLIRTWY